MLQNEFEEKLAIIKCKKCKKTKVGCTRRKSVIATPNELLIVVDRFDSKGKLRKLLPTVPKDLDLEEYLNKEAADEGTITKYVISGFICQDPIHRDYSVYLKNEHFKQGDCEWTMFNMRERSRVRDDLLFNNKVLKSK